MITEAKEFWERVVIAFGTDNVAEIAGKLRLKVQALYKWQKGTIPEWRTLQKINNLTGSSIHWLLTGEGSKEAGSFDIESKIRFSDLERKIVTQLAVEANRTFTEEVRQLVLERLITRGLMTLDQAVENEIKLRSERSQMNAENVELIEVPEYDANLMNETPEQRRRRLAEDEKKKRVGQG